MPARHAVHMLQHVQHFTTECWTHCDLLPSCCCCMPHGICTGAGALHGHGDAAARAGAAPDTLTFYGREEVARKPPPALEWPIPLPSITMKGLHEPLPTGLGMCIQHGSSLPRTTAPVVQAQSHSVEVLIHPTYLWVQCRVMAVVGCLRRRTTFGAWRLALGAWRWALGAWRLPAW